jgi:Protein of unknown function (DUF1570)
MSGRTIRRAVGTVLLLLACVAGGCHTTSVPKTRQLPKHCEIDLDQLTVRSDIEIDRDDPLLRELVNLRKEVRSTLHLPEASRPVTVYLFRDESRYMQYMRDRHPTLPARRAFFIGTPKELMVYAYWGDKTLEDLRHEYTHGVLHASLKTVPLWLDEGLAEYFEVAPEQPVGLNQDHAESLSLAIQNGWRPDLKRLEQIDDVSQMQRADYQEAWAWVHYLLQGTPDGPLVLTGYLQSLNKASHAPSFASRVSGELPECEERLTVHVASLNLPIMQAGHSIP